MSTPRFPPLSLPEGITESYVPSHDLTYHVLTAGSPKNPLILCLHGFPELAFSWRKIMPQIAAEGYHVVAYDQRGYGRTTNWDARPFSTVDLNTFTFSRLVRDALILINALGHTSVSCILGHDFGAVGASYCALMRPDVFKSVIIMSHPFKGSPTLPFNTLNQTPIAPKPDVHADLAALPEPRKHYKWYYSTSPAAAEMDFPKESLHDFLRGYFYLKSADWDGNDPKALAAWSASELQKLPYYYVMPLNSSMREAVESHMKSEDPNTVISKSDRWLPDPELAVYAQEWARTGFQGGLNWYRVATEEANMKDVELFAGKKVEVPLLFVSGRRDWGMYQEPGVVEKLEGVCEKGRFKGVEVVEGAGHWVQQEQSGKVVEIVSKFLRDVKKEGVSM